MFISVLGVKMRLYRLVTHEGTSYTVAPSQEYVDDYDNERYFFEEVKLDGELVPLPTLEQLVKMGIAERWDD